MTVQTGCGDTLDSFHFGMQLALEPELDAEGCVVQLISRYGRTQRIFLFNAEPVVPETPSYEGIGNVGGIVHGIGLGVGETGGKADLGGPANDADVVPELVAEGEGPEVLGCP